jgi:tetratricopeptide (TPR) repeat protein
MGLHTGEPSRHEDGYIGIDVHRAARIAATAHGGQVAPDDAGAPLAQLTHWLGVMLDEQGEPEAARGLFERSLAIWRELGDRDRQARELSSLGVTHRWLGHLDTARSVLEESAAIAREIGVRRPVQRAPAGSACAGRFSACRPVRAPGRP